MTRYQDCHRHYGYLTHETAIARKLLERHGIPCPETVKELRNETDMPMAECADMLRCTWRDMELERLQAENAKLRELCRRYGEYLSQDRCEGCVCKTRCNNGLIDECWQLGGIRDLTSELGLEVDW